MRRSCRNLCELCFKFPVHGPCEITKVDSCREIVRRDADEIDSTAGLLVEESLISSAIYNEDGLDAPTLTVCKCLPSQGG